MKLKDSIKFGLGLYIGWTIASSMDEVLGRVLSKCHVTDKVNGLISEKQSGLEREMEKRIVGFGSRE